MTTERTTNGTSLAADTSPDFDLFDGNRRIGWIRGSVIGFRGFESETEAAHAAWVAYRILGRRLARRHGGGSVPVDAGPLSIVRDGDREAILASSRPIASLLRPGTDSRSAADTFGFEIDVPLPPDQLTMRSIAYRIYRTLRASGAGWARWDAPRPGAPPRERPQPG